jgi:hypothetical protein
VNADGNRKNVFTVACTGSQISKITPETPNQWQLHRYVLALSNVRLYLFFAGAVEKGGYRNLFKNFPKLADNCRIEFKETQN